MTKSHLKKFAKRFIHDEFAADEYVKAAKERYEDVIRERGEESFPDDGIIEKYHIASNFKKANLYKVKTRMMLTKDFIMGELEGNIEGKSFLDIGASSTIFFKVMDISPSEGYAVNIDKSVIENIKKEGYHATLVYDERLPLDDNSFDYCFSFQCLEHTHSPICHIKEMLRVARFGVYVSIPFRKKTVIVAKKANSTPDDQHIYEFSPQELGTIAAHAGGRMVRWTSFALEKNGTRNPLKYLYRKRCRYGRPSVALAYLVSA